MLRLLVPSATTRRVPGVEPPSNQPRKSETSLTNPIASQARQPRPAIAPN